MHRPHPSGAHRNHEEETLVRNPDPQNSGKFSLEVFP